MLSLLLLSLMIRENVKICCYESNAAKCSSDADIISKYSEYQSKSIVPFLLKETVETLSFELYDNTDYFVVDPFQVQNIEIFSENNLSFLIIKSYCKVTVNSNVTNLYAIRKYDKADQLINFPNSAPKNFHFHVLAIDPSNSVDIRNFLQWNDSKRFISHSPPIIAIPEESMAINTTWWTSNRKLSIETRKFPLSSDSHKHDINHFEYDDDRGYMASKLYTTLISPWLDTEYYIKGSWLRNLSVNIETRTDKKVTLKSSASKYYTINYFHGDLNLTNFGSRGFSFDYFYDMCDPTKTKLCHPNPNKKVNSKYSYYSTFDCKSAPLYIDEVKEVKDLHILSTTYSSDLRAYHGSCYFLDGKIEAYGKKENEDGNYYTSYRIVCSRAFFSDKNFTYDIDTKFITITIESDAFQLDMDQFSDEYMKSFIIRSERKDRPRVTINGNKPKSDIFWEFINVDVIGVKLGISNQVMLQKGSTLNIDNATCHLLILVDDMNAYNYEGQRLANTRGKFEIKSSYKTLLLRERADLIMNEEADIVFESNSLHNYVQITGSKISGTFRNFRKLSISAESYTNLKFSGVEEIVFYEKELHFSEFSFPTEIESTIIGCPDGNITIDYVKAGKGVYFRRLESATNSIVTIKKLNLTDDCVVILKGIIVEQVEMSGSSLLIFESTRGIKTSFTINSAEFLPMIQMSTLSTAKYPNIHLKHDSSCSPGNTTALTDGKLSFYFLGSYDEFSYNDRRSSIQSKFNSTTLYLGTNFLQKTKGVTAFFKLAGLLPMSKCLIPVIVVDVVFFIIGLIISFVSPNKDGYDDIVSTVLIEMPVNDQEEGNEEMLDNNVQYHQGQYQL